MTVISVHSIIKHLSERGFIVIHCQIPGLDYIFLSSFLRFLLLSKHYTWEYEDFDWNDFLLMKIFDHICIRAIIRNLGGICPEDCYSSSQAGFLLENHGTWAANYFPTFRPVAKCMFTHLRISRPPQSHTILLLKTFPLEPLPPKTTRPSHPPCPPHHLP